MPIAHHEMLHRLARIADAMERSWSISASGTERRVLMFFDATSPAISQLTEAAEKLGLPATMIAAWRRALPAADALGLAVRDDLTSVRLYTQYWDAVANRVRAGNHAPSLLYAGFKGLPNDTTRIDAYVCQPMVPRSVFMPPIHAAFDALGVSDKAVTEAFAPLTEDACIFTQTQTDERQSWLATVRRADLSQASVTRALSEMSSEIAHRGEIITAARSRDLVQIAGGTDTVKGAFQTLYFASDPTELDTALTPR